MALRILAAGAALTMLTAPAWADCAEEVEALEAEVVAAETGAATEASEGMPATEHQAEVLSDEAGGDSESVAESDMPATQHQEEVLSGEEAPVETGAGIGDVEATTPHQRQAVRALDEDTKVQATTLLEEARAMAQSGDEAGCQDKLSEARELVGAQ